jgi:ParB/RepB/Spo0J family partition protein
MSAKLEGHMGRIDVASLDPSAVLDDEKFNTRCVPYTQEEVEALGRTIHREGQLQPCVGRKVEGNKIQMVCGFGRVRAIKWINATLRAGQPPMPVLVRVRDMNDEEAWICSIQENKQRKDTCPIDDAHAQRVLREHFGWSEERIAELYSCSVSHLSNLRKTLTLPAEVRSEIKSENLPISQAVVLADLPHEEIKEIVSSSKNGDGKIDTKVLKKKVRAVKENNGKNVARTAADLRRYFTELLDNQQQDGVQAIAENMLKFLKGEITEKMMTFWLATRTKSLK